MFKEMRRKKKQMDEARARTLLETGEYGILATQGEEGYPYALPLNYTVIGDALYFHCAPTGHKLDNIRHNERVSFCVVSQAEILAKEFSTRFKSVVVFGRAVEVKGEEKEAALLALIHRFSPEFLKEGKAYIKKAGAKTCVVKIQMESITGKSGE